MKKKLVSVALMLMLVCSILPLKAYAEDLSWTDVDYSGIVSLGTNEKVTINADDTPLSPYEEVGVTYYAEGRTVALESGKTYALSLLNAGSGIETELDLMISGTLTGDYDLDSIQYIDCSTESGTQTQTMLYSCEESGNYRLLAVAGLKVGESMECTVLVSEVSALTPAADKTETGADYSAGALSNDSKTFYTADYDDVADDGKYYLRAIDAVTGALKWTFELVSDSDCTPMVGPDGTIYVGTYQDYDAQADKELAYLYAVNPDGTEKWATAIDGTDIYAAIWGSLTFAGSNTVVAISENFIRAFDATTGAALWTSEPVEYPLEYLDETVNNVVADNNSLYAMLLEHMDLARRAGGTGNATLQSFDLATGELNWELDTITDGEDTIVFPYYVQSTGAYRCANLAINDGTVYALGYIPAETAVNSLARSPSNIDQYCLVALKPSGEVKWISYFNDSVNELLERMNPDSISILAGESSVYFVTGGNENLAMLQLSAADGTAQAIRQMSLPDDAVDFGGAALSADGDLWFTDEERLYRFGADGTVSFFGGDHDFSKSIPAIGSNGYLLLSGEDETYTFNIGVGPMAGFTSTFGSPMRTNRWETVKVTYNTNGGAAVADEEIAYGGAAAAPATTKTGATFTGWFVDEACTVAYTGQALYGATALYAGWKSVSPATGDSANLYAMAAVTVLCAAAFGAAAFRKKREA